MGSPGSPEMIRIGSVEAEKSTEVSLSLQCPQIFTAGGGAGGAAAGPGTLGEGAADEWTFDDPPKVHGDVEDSGALDSDTVVPGDSPLGRIANGTATPATSRSISSPGLSKTTSSTGAGAALVPGAPSGALKAGPRTRRKKAMHFRMDGDMGLMSCVRVLFAASRDARGTITDEMMQMLLDHGVLKPKDLETSEP
jgi:hypothetical protein